MNIWVKRYIILTICFVIAILPTLSIMNNFGLFSDDNSKLIAILIIVGLALIYYGIMTFLMLRKKG